MRGVFDSSTDYEGIEYLDFREPEIGFLAALNDVTVLEVYSATGLEMINGLEANDTPRVWTPQARYYLFKFVEPSDRLPSKYLGPGLRWLCEDEWMPFPGTMIGGQLVHWEVDCVFDHPMPLPDELRNNELVKS